MIPKIILVDDHLMFRQGLKSVLAAEKIAQVIGEASNGNQFIEMLPDLKPDIVLMDIDMPGMNGIESTRRAIELLPDLKIIALSMYSDEEYYYKMIESGVKGFVLKSTGISEVEKAIKDVMTGESFFSNELLRKIIQRMSKPSAPRSEISGKDLSHREKEVLRCICQGLSTDEIAAALSIGTTTVKSHRASLLEKTASKNTPALILYALKNKIVDL